MIVTIDGPAGAGKSTIARGLARRLGFRFLDTGAMYRAVALAAIRHGHDWSEPLRLVELARRLKLDVGEDHVTIGGVDVTRDIRSSEVTAATHYAADNPGVRARTWSSCSARRPAAMTSSPRGATRARSCFPKRQ